MDAINAESYFFFIKILLYNEFFLLWVKQSLRRDLSEDYRFTSIRIELISDLVAICHYY
jgi:hypothetical protein